MAAAKLRIGTRGSPLALWQATNVRDRLLAAHGWGPGAIEITVIKTSGDRIQDRPLSEVGGKGLFTKEIEDALIAKTIDLAVHSMKDVATVLPEGLIIACLLPREDPRDAFVSLKSRTLADLHSGAVVGTASLRRQSQVLRLRPDLKVISFRGNVETRLRKLAEGAADATLLAMAGLNRLGLAGKATSVMSTTDMLPAIAQGAIGIEIRTPDAETARLIEPLNDMATAVCVAAERAFLARLDGSCRTPIAGLASIKGDRLEFSGMILSTDGGRIHAAKGHGAIADASRIGDEAGEQVLAAAGPEFLAKA